MKNTERMTEKQINDIAHKMGASIYDNVNYIIQYLFKELFDKGKSTNINDFVNILLIAITSADVSILMQIKMFYYNYTLKEIDVDKLVNTYMLNLDAQLPDEFKKYKKTVN